MSHDANHFGQPRGNLGLQVAFMGRKVSGVVLLARRHAARQHNLVARLDLVVGDVAGGDAGIAMLLNRASGRDFLPCLNNRLPSTVPDENEGAGGREFRFFGPSAWPHAALSAQVADSSGVVNDTGLATMVRLHLLELIDAVARCPHVDSGRLLQGR
jgi:hypothetical protein